MENIKVYDYEYFNQRTPFRTVMNRFCNLEIDTYRTGSYDFGSATLHHDISYDAALFIENIAEIKQALLRTKFCKYVESMKEKIEKIPETLDEYENAYAINKVVSDIIIDGCISHKASSHRYNWEVKNKYSDNMEFNISCAKKMEKPVIRLFEVNGWERESWNFYFDFPFDDNKMSALGKLADRVSKMEKVQQCNGKSYFEIMFVPKEFDSINWGICHGYMNKNNYIEGTLNVEKVEELLGQTDNYIFECLYKGGIQYLFNKEC